MVTLVQGSADISLYSTMRGIGRRTGELEAIKEVSIQYRRLVHCDGSDTRTLCFRCLFVDPFPAFG